MRGGANLYTRGKPSTMASARTVCRDGPINAHNKNWKTNETKHSSACRKCSTYTARCYSISYHTFIDVTCRCTFPILLSYTSPAPLPRRNELRPTQYSVYNVYTNSLCNVYHLYHVHYVLRLLSLPCAQYILVQCVQCIKIRN